MILKALVVAGIASVIATTTSIASAKDVGHVVAVAEEKLPIRPLLLDEDDGGDASQLPYMLPAAITTSSGGSTWMDALAYSTSRLPLEVRASQPNDSILSRYAATAPPIYTITQEQAHHIISVVMDDLAAPTNLAFMIGSEALLARVLPRSRGVVVLAEEAPKGRLLPEGREVAAIAEEAAKARLLSEGRAALGAGSAEEVVATRQLTEVESALNADLKGAWEDFGSKAKWLRNKTAESLGKKEFTFAFDAKQTMDKLGPKAPKIAFSHTWLWKEGEGWTLKPSSFLDGATDSIGNIFLPPNKDLTSVLRTFYHERVHSWLSVGKNGWRSSLSMLAYERIAMVRFLEEATAETYSLIRVDGLNVKALASGMKFPLQSGYGITLFPAKVTLPGSTHSIWQLGLVPEAGLVGATTAGGFYGGKAVIDQAIAASEPGPYRPRRSAPCAGLAVSRQARAAASGGATDRKQASGTFPSRPLDVVWASLPGRRRYCHHSAPQRSTYHRSPDRPSCGRKRFAHLHRHQTLPRSAGCR